MKFKTIATLILVITLPVSAQNMSHEEIDDICTKWASMAEGLMENRQVGVPMSDMMGISPNNTAWRTMVTEAYSQSRYSSDSVRIRVIEEFRDSNYLRCIRMFSELNK